MNLNAAEFFEHSCDDFGNRARSRVLIVSHHDTFVGEKFLDDLVTPLCLAHVLNMILLQKMIDLLRLVVDHKVYDAVAYLLKGHWVYLGEASSDLSINEIAVACRWHEVERGSVDLYSFSKPFRKFFKVI